MCKFESSAVINDLIITSLPMTMAESQCLYDLANYLDLTFITESNNRLYTKLYDRRDDLDFHIVNFPFLSSNMRPL